MTTHIARIIVGYDGSPDADVAATWAGRMAHLRGEPLVAAIVVDWMESPRRPNWPETWWGEIEERARQVLATTGDTDVTVERLHGGVVQTLVDSSRDASMLVLGSRGHGRIGEALLGSVSQSAARRARCPVAVIRKAADHENRRIVVGVDDSEPSLRALDFACHQAAVTGDTVMIYRAWKPVTMPVDRYGNLPASMSRSLLEEEEGLQKSVAEARTRHQEIEIEGEFIAVGASQALVEASHSATMVVVGSRGHNALTETVLGSVSNNVLHHARCPVAVVR